MSEHLPDVGQFLIRVIQDAMIEATAAYWLRRAQQLEDARPRYGDFNGAVTPVNLIARDERLAAQSQACRNRASMSELNIMTPEEVDLLTDLVTGSLTDLLIGNAA